MSLERRRFGHNTCAGGAGATEGILLGSPTRIFIGMDAPRRRDRLIDLLSPYGQLHVVGAEVADYRALRAIVARHPDLVIIAPSPEAVGRGAWLTRQVNERMPDCAIVAAAGDDQLPADRCLPVDAPLTDLIEAALHAPRTPHAPGRRGARTRPA